MGAGKGKNKRTKTQTAVAAPSTAKQKQAKQVTKIIGATEFQKLVTAAAGASLIIGALDKNERTVVKNASLTDILLQQIMFLNCELKNCDFEDKQFEDCVLQYCTVTGGKLGGSQFKHSALKGVVWKSVDEAKFVEFDRCELNNFSLIGSGLPSAVITDCDLDGFFVDKKSSIKNSHIEKSELRKARFDGDASGLTTKKTNWDQSEFRGEALIDASLNASNFKKTDFSKVNLDETEMRDSEFDACDFGEFNLGLAEKIQGCEFNNCVDNKKPEIIKPIQVAQRTA